MRIVLFFAALVAQFPAWVPAFAGDSQFAPKTEIEFLLTAVGDSGCLFVRNGETYPSSDAEAHLRMKYRRGERYAPTAEKFIERLASGSSISKEPYLIRCGDEAPIPTGDWFFEQLREYRSVD